MVLMLSVGSIMLATQRLVLQSAAAEIARHEARGDHASAGAVLGGLGSGPRAGPSVSRTSVGPLHCVTLIANPVGGLLSSIAVTGRGCAAKSEEST